MCLAAHEKDSIAERAVQSLAARHNAQLRNRHLFSLLLFLLHHRISLLRAVQLVQSAQSLRGPLPESVGHRGAVPHQLHTAAGQHLSDWTFCDVVYPRSKLRRALLYANSASSIKVIT